MICLRRDDASNLGKYLNIIDTSNRTYLALEELKKGNERFYQGNQRNRNINIDKARHLYGKSQKPKAILLACSDSRVPPELIFDQGLGSLFVIRNAGNVVDDHVLGGIEYAAEYLNTPLVFVLAHNMCGAIQATVDGGPLTENVDKIRTHIEESIGLDTISKYDKREATTLLEDANLMQSINDIMENKVVQERVAKGLLKVTGGKYDLGTGKVTFLED